VKSGVVIFYLCPLYLYVLIQFTVKFKTIFYITILFIGIGLISCENENRSHHGHEHEDADKQVDTTTHYPQEKHLANIRQLTFGGDNAEAYFSFDNSMIVFQAKNPDWNAPCDQIYVFPFSDDNMKNKMPQLISEGLGRTTCSFFMPGDSV